MTDAAELAASDAGDGLLEYELQQACAAVRFASALCQVCTTASVHAANVCIAVDQLHACPGSHIPLLAFAESSSA